MPYNIVRLGDETRIHTSTSGPQYGIQWVELPDGRFVMLWYGDGDQPGQGDTSGYFQQLFDANGQKIGSETRVNGTIDGSVGSEAFSVSLPIGGVGIPLEIVQRRPSPDQQHLLPPIRRGRRTWRAGQDQHDAGRFRRS